MNFTYSLNSETGMLSLKFKNNILDSMSKDTQTIFKDYIIPIMQMNSKFVLTGSLSLKLLGFEPLDEVGDFDFGLLDTFTEEDYNNLKNFFGLNDIKHDGYALVDDLELNNKSNKFNPKDHLWQFSKIWKIEEDDIDSFLLSNKYFKMDVFNDEIIRSRDVITIYWDDFEVRLVHPSITLSYRMRYALDIRSSSTYKYWERMKKFMDDAKSYYHHVRKVSKMIERVYEHNWNIEDDKEKINRIRNLIVNREANADMFFDKAFKDIISGEIQIT